MRKEEPMTAVPLVVAREAAAAVAYLGMQRELDLMLDWVRQNVPALQGIRVAVGDRLGSRLGPTLVIWAHRGPLADPASRDLDGWDGGWVEWKIRAFPPHVCTRFTMIPACHPLRARDAA